jgi:hypothetical protein
MFNQVWVAVIGKASSKSFDDTGGSFGLLQQ